MKTSQTLECSKFIYSRANSRNSIVLSFNPFHSTVASASWLYTDAHRSSEGCVFATPVWGSEVGAKRLSSKQNIISNITMQSPFHLTSFVLVSEYTMY